jgi:hypothetical protein
MVGEDVPRFKSVTVSCSIKGRGLNVGEASFEVVRFEETRGRCDVKS